MNRLKAVALGDAEIYLRFFDSSLYTEFHAATLAEAQELMERVKSNSYSGGATDITGCAIEAQKRIEEIVSNNEQFYKPELVIVTDGYDVVSLELSDFKGTKVHAFVVQGSNDRLVEFAISTGGVGINNLRA
jgi:uncharacterized protein with von Willebrand factor type A (vWA) domain